jgi:hypothetical protein
MQVHEHPKPKIFGKGYGAHIAYHFRVFTVIAKILLQLTVTMFLPRVYHQKYHWDIIDLYYKLRGERHGTANERRCDECGTELMSRDDKISLDEAEELIEQLKEENAYLEWHEPHNEDVLDSDK